MKNKKSQEDNINENDLNLQNDPNTSEIKKKKGNKVLKIALPICLLCCVICIILIVVGLKYSNVSNPIPAPNSENPIVENPIEEPVVTKPIEEETIEITESEDEVEKYAYDNSLLGIKFNYDSNLYMKENVEEIFNTIKGVIPEGRDNFNIYSDKLDNILNIVKLTTGDSDGLYISVSILPFEIEKETTTLKIDGTTEVKNESIESINLTDEELVSKYDTQIKETLAQSNCEIISYDKSSVIGVGTQTIDGAKKLKGILTSRTYSGPVEVTTSTGVVGVIQCTIPVGKNAILVTAVTDGRPIEIDKTAIFNQIVNSMFVVADGPIVENSVVEDSNNNNVKGEE